MARAEGAVGGTVPTNSVNWNVGSLASGNAVSHATMSANMAVVPLNVGNLVIGHLAKSLVL